MVSLSKLSLIPLSAGSDYFTTFDRTRSLRDGANSGFSMGDYSSLSKKPLGVVLPCSESTTKDYASLDNDNDTDARIAENNSRLKDGQGAFNLKCHDKSDAFGQSSKERNLKHGHIAVNPNVARNFVLADLSEKHGLAPTNESHEYFVLEPHC